jgi:hypothetical protein
MSPREIKTHHNGQKQQALENLWVEIEKALLQSASVRVSLTNYQALEQVSESLQDTIVLNIEKLKKLVENHEKNALPASETEPSAEEIFRRMVKELRGHLIKSIQTNLNLIESSTKLSMENERLRNDYAILEAKHKKALENIEKILMNITRNPN